MIPLRDVNPASRTAWITIVLIVANVVSFVVWQPSPIREGYSSRAAIAFLYEHAMVPCEITRLEPLSDRLASECDRDRIGETADGTPYFPGKNVLASVLASLFFHGNLAHLLGNLWFLVIFGNNVEDRLGPLRYAVFYLAGGIAASVGHVAFHPNSVLPVIGASGAIAAVMGAYLVMFPRARIITLIPPIFWRTFRLWAWVVLLEWLIVQFFTDPATGVAWIAHVAGFVFGIATALLMGRRTPQRTRAEVDLAERRRWPDRRR